MINDIQRRILAEAAKFGGSNVSSAQIIANNLNEANHQSFMNGGAGGVATFGFGKAQFEGKMRQLLVKMGFEKGINKMDINGNKMVLYFANRAKANDFVITFNGLVKRSSKGSPATLSTSFDKIKSPAGTNAVVTVDFSMMKTEDLENGSDVFVMLEALYENSIEEAKTKNTHVTSVPAGASEKEFAKARAANPYRVRLGKGVPAGAKNEETEIEEAKAKIKYLTGPGKRDSKRIIGIYTMQGKWVKDMNTEKEAMNFVNKSWGESVEEEVKNIEESATKAALEDFMYDALPKAAIAELQPIFKNQSIRGSQLRDKVSTVLKKHKVPTFFMGTSAAQIVIDNFETFHGESVEEEEELVTEVQTPERAKEMKQMLNAAYKKQQADLKKAFRAGANEGDPIINRIDREMHKLERLDDKEKDAKTKMFGKGGKIVNEENLNIGTNGFRIDRDGGKFVLYQLSYSQGSVRFPDGRKGTVIGRYATRDEAIAAAKRNAGVKEEVEVAEQFKAGDKVKVPHKGKMVSGKIVRYDDGGTDKARQHGGGYVVDVGEPASVLVPKQKVQKEAYAHPDEKVIGSFYEKSHNQGFEYRISKNSWGKSHSLPHEVCVSRKDYKSGGDWRAANVKGTVCYIAVDEGEGGKPVIEKWDIKKHVKYVKAD